MKKRMAVLAVVWASAHALSANLFIYEGFDAGVTADTPIIGGGLSGATSMGLSGVWGAVSAGNGVETAVFQPSGLSMANFLTVPGALRVGTSGSGTAGVNAFRQVSVGAANRSTLFGSFLFRTQSAGPQYVSVMGIETGAGTNFAGTAITPHRLGDNDDPFRFNIGPDSYNAEGYSSGLKLRRWNSVGSMAAVGGVNGLSADTTYLAIWKVTNAYTADPRDQNQEGSVWILGESQYAAGAGSLTESFLAANSLYTVSVTNGLAAGLLAGDYLNIAALAAGVAGSSQTIYDEIRIGSNLASVAPVPEPSLYASLVGGLCLLAVWLQRRGHSGKVA